MPVCSRDLFRFCVSLAAFGVASGALIGCSASGQVETSEQQVQQAAQRDDGAPVEFQEAPEELDDFSRAGIENTIPTLVPLITEPTIPAADGLTAGVTRGGVLVEVVAETKAGGYVVTTPCRFEVVVDDLEPATGARVVLDPGHGGDEPGADDIDGLSEAELNLLVVEAALEALDSRGIKAVSTRGADFRLPVARRAELADAVGADIFVSVHHNNGASSPSAKPGTEIYIQNKSEASRRLGGLLYEEVVESLSAFDVRWNSRGDAGVLVVLNDASEDAYGINRRPETPSALVEMGYMGNRSEANLFQTDAYVQAGGEALAEGIERYLTSSATGSGYRDRPRLFNPSGDTGGSEDCVDPVLE